MKRKNYFIFPIIWLFIALGNTFEKYFMGVLVSWATEDLGKLKTGIVVLLAVLLSKYLLDAFGRWSFHCLLDKEMTAIKKNILEKLLYADFCQIEKITKGDLLSKITLGLKTLQNFEADVKPDMLQSVVEGIAAIFICVSIHPLLALAAFGSIPLIILINILASLPVNPLIERRNQLENESGSCAMNFLAHIKSVISLGIEQVAIEKYEKSVDNVCSQSIKIADRRALLTCLDALNFILPYMIMFGAGFALSLKGKISVGEMISFAYLMNAVTNAIGKMPTYFYEMSEKKKAKEMLEKIFALTKPFGFEHLQRSRDGGISMEQVTFSYSNGMQSDPPLTAAVKNINLFLKKGEKAVIVGKSGSGKSTLMKLLMGLYDAEQGMIHIGGDTACLNQEMYLFPMGIKENIQCGNTGMGTEEIKNVARQAGILDLLEKNGNQCREHLSGGERQRLCLARMYAMDKEIILCDEPTSSLDKKLEENIWSHILGLPEETTVLAITHAITYAKQFQRIFYMENGEIAEEGTHQELMAKKGKYYSFYRTSEENVS